MNVIDLGGDATEQVSFSSADSSEARPQNSHSLLNWQSDGWDRTDPGASGSSSSAQTHSPTGGQATLSPDGSATAPSRPRPPHCMPLALLEHLARLAPSKKVRRDGGGKATVQGGETARVGATGGSRISASGSTKLTPQMEERAKRYLAKIEGGIQGQNGSDPMMWAARGMAWGFLFSDEDSLDLLRKYYTHKCVPIWEDWEIQHKISEARKPGFHLPEGWLLDKKRPNESKSTSRAGAPTQAIPGDASTSGPNDSPDNPHRLAAGFLETHSPGGPPFQVRFWRGDYHRYHDGAYRVVPDSDLRGELTSWVRAEFIKQNLLDLEQWADNGGKGAAPEVRKVTAGGITNVIQAMGGMSLLPAAVEAPAWINGASGPEPSRVLSMKNGLLDLETATAGRPGCLLPASPSFFTPTAAPFIYDPTAPAPVEWQKFLSELWPEERENAACLQEWFGYLLTPDTRQHKILFLLGPPRGGKGTVARVLKSLIGPDNMAGPTLASLSMNFGLSALLGKSVAVVADARLSGRVDSAVVTERLLSISGEDTLTIDRKHREPLTVKLNTRFVILSNELPRLGDASGALAGRFIILRLTRSWYGKEDHGLFDRLRTELPGILLWAIEGWRRLRDRGRFIQPASGQALVSEMQALSSPVGSFVKDRCIVGPGFRVEISELYSEWRKWCEAHGRKEAGTEELFGRDLRAAVPSIDKGRPRSSEGRLNVYKGIRLRTLADPDPADEQPGGRGGQCGHSDQTLHAKWNPVEVNGHIGGVAENIDAMGGHYDHGDHTDNPDLPATDPDPTRPRRRYENDDRTDNSTVADPIEPRRFLPGHPRASLDSLGFYDCHFGINYSRNKGRV